jgi:hypothetical protein
MKSYNCYHFTYRKIPTPSHFLLQTHTHIEWCTLEQTWNNLFFFWSTAFSVVYYELGEINGQLQNIPHPKLMFSSREYTNTWIFQTSFRVPQPWKHFKHPTTTTTKKRQIIAILGCVLYTHVRFCYGLGEYPWVKALVLGWCCWGMMETLGSGIWWVVLRLLRACPWKGL